MELGRRLCPGSKNRQPEEGRGAMPLTGHPSLRQVRTHCSPGRAHSKEGVRLQGPSPRSSRTKGRCPGEDSDPLHPFSLQAPPVGTTCAPTPHMWQVNRRAHQEDLAAAPQVGTQHQGRRLQRPACTLSPRSAADSCGASVWLSSGAGSRPSAQLCSPRTPRGNRGKSQPLGVRLRSAPWGG